jgi:hypothetical protein
MNLPWPYSIRCCHFGLKERAIKAWEQEGRPLQEFGSDPNQPGDRYVDKNVDNASTDPARRGPSAGKLQPLGA